MIQQYNNKMIKINRKLWKRVSDYLTPIKDSLHLVVGGNTSGQSSFDKGMVINDGGTGDVADDFRVETFNNEYAFFVDASIDNVGINTSTPNSSLQVEGSISKPIASKTTNYTLNDEDYTILLDGTSNTVTATLPTAVGITGRIYNIKCIDDTNQCDIDPDGIEEIDSNNANFILTKHETITIQSDGSNWWII